ncbi:MAG: OmpA family protein [Planctomycetota bacterium]|nr:OmpA family protein [Planctomycetota bacterium]
MQYRSILVVALVASATLMSSCSARYQNLLRDRDQQIRELNGRVASLRAENEDLTRELQQASETVEPLDAGFSPQDALQDELGDQANISYRNGRLAIGVEDSVTFNSGSTELKKAAHGILNKIEAVLVRDFTDCRYFIEGHTDSDPIRKTKNQFKSNRHLSVMRADAVARYLIKQGLPEDRIVVVGYGQFDPLDPNVKARNRRVEIVPVRN